MNVYKVQTFNLWYVEEHDLVNWKMIIIQSSKLEKLRFTKDTRPFESVTDSFILTIASLAEISS